MSKHDSAPTYSWVFGSKLTKWLASIFILLLLASFIAVWTIRYSLARDCHDVYERKLSTPGHWIVIMAGSKEPGCPQSN